MLVALQRSSDVADGDDGISGDWIELDQRQSKPYLGEPSSLLSQILVSSAPTTRMLNPEKSLTVNPET
jgi:hypothetical protein